MHKSTQFKKLSKDPQFVKGMTLSQYLSFYPAFPPLDRQVESEQKQQNLYQSSHYGLRKRMQSKNSQIGIQEIDEQSIEDSVQYDKSNKTRATPFFEQQKQQEIRNNQQILPKQGLNYNRNRISLNSRQSFQNSSLDKNIFRVKKMSMSPAKSKNEQALGSGSVTLYGIKFGMAKKKQEFKTPDLLTFYGKLSIGQQQVKMKQKTSWKGDMKQNFKKKNQLQLKQLLLMQDKIKNTKSLGTNNQEMMVLGVKDKLIQRRQKHTQRH